ncbi:MAG: DUF559 domain-containing protein [Candidatus Marinimicrobia bacterium]|jgi:very-short-patch-repair endonuclease|nr:DUF559 domain-containing protein [Candidatus Neomarinimicrobiota bacterium]MBT3633095.1 DUF559 domain-containing protein [Candidatus Neomarinimicrobiota bacterium]MBT3682304.1 DUF559 domain-containing protein [Candidatus Neomarinimicrobiota bacterium]MBT3758695.1 DUF559 domain-containing protein [Candidatus Neomarinimicrobiota bacterium]MBT3895431.1 DUF559 domain-containing protein [Candidatus Neomarinimicrobiota bacterium]
MVESKELIELAREFRKNPTPAENKLWGYLKNKQLDGPIHNNPDVINNDKKREEYLKENGIIVIHFKNHNIFDNPKKVLKSILYYIEKTKQKVN